MKTLVVHEIDTEEAQALLSAEPGCQLIDVRELWEYEQGHLPGALTVPLGELPTRMADLDPGRRICVVCARGMRSYEAACFLAERDFAEVVNLSEGTLGWMRRGLPLEN